MSEERRTVEETIRQIEDSYDAWQATLARVPAERMEEPLKPDGWSVKDIIAHITWHEAQMVDVLEAKALVGSQYWQFPVHVRNRRIYLDHKLLPLQSVLDDAKVTHEQLMQGLRTLTEEELNEPGVLADMPSDWRFREVLSDNTDAHYNDHARTVGRWLEGIE